MSKVLQKLAAEKAIVRATEEKKAGKGQKRAIESEASVGNTKKTKLSTTLRPIDSSKASDKKKELVKSTIIYLGHIPEGFGENEMRQFFRQFGEVKRLKLFRSKKTNRSRGFAFVEFESPEVASVVAESMNGYYLMERQLVSNVVAPEKFHRNMFSKPSKKDDEIKDDNEEKEEKEEEMTEEKANKLLAKHQKSMLAKQKKLTKLGIDFTIQGVEVNEVKQTKQIEETPAQPIKKTKVTNDNKATPKKTPKKK